MDKVEIGTTRMFSQALDAMGIDIWVAPDINFPFDIQCKKSLSQSKFTKKIDISALVNLSRKKKRKNIPVLFSKLTYKSDRAKKREQSIGEFMVIDAEIGIKMLKLWTDANKNTE